MAEINANVRRIQGVDRFDLGNQLKTKMLGYESATRHLGFKNSAGDMVWFPSEGSEASFNNVTIDGIATGYAQNIGIDANGKVIVRADGGASASYGNGVVGGMELSIGTPNTTFSISAGMYNTTTELPYDGASNISVTNIATQNATYIAIDPTDNSIVQSSEPFTASQRRDYVILGVIVHSNRSTVTAVNNLPDVALLSLAQLNDLMDGLRNFNIDGNVISANGANLSINKSAGDIFKKGVNFQTDNTDPHTVSLAGLIAPANLRFRTSTGDETADTNVFPLKYENGAGGAVNDIPQNRFAIYRVNLFSSNLIRIQYGQAIYQTMAEAVAGITTESFVTESNIADNALLRAFVIVKGDTTSMLDTTKVKFVASDKWGEMPIGGTGGITTLQGAYNNSVDPEIVTNSTLGAVSIKRGSVADTDNVFEVLNGVGSITAYIKGDGSNNLYPYADVKDPTGFTEPSLITVSYDSTTRIVTLTGTVKALWRGQVIPALVSGWASTAHTNTTGNWYLYYNGTAFVWSQTPWTFDMLQICEVYFGATSKFAVREVHSFMDYATHANLHYNIGTYKKSGGAFSSFTLNSTTVANRRPTLASTVIIDEDLETTNAQVATGAYNRFSLSGAGVANYTVDQADVTSTGAGGRANYNLNTGGTWTTVESANNTYGKIFVVNIPVTSDATSQKYRTLYVMPQTVSTTLATIKALTPANVNWGSIGGAGVNEFVFVGEIIIQSTTNNWQLIEVNVLSGNKISQTSIVNPSATPSLAQVLTAGKDGTKLGITNLGNLDSGDITSLGGVATGKWQVSSPVYIGDAPNVVGMVVNTTANGAYIAQTLRDAGSGYGDFMYYRRVDGVNTWYIVREGWYWLITNNITTPTWNNSIATGAGGLATPDGFYTKYNAETSDNIYVTMTAGSSIVDALVVEGSMYCDQVIKTKDGFNIGNNAFMMYDNQVGAEAFRISTANPDVQFAYYSKDGNASLEGCTLSAIGQYPDDVLVRGVTDQPWYNAIQLNGFTISDTDPTDGQVLKYDTTTGYYIPVTIGGGDVTSIESSSSDNAVVAFSGATGKSIKARTSSAYSVIGNPLGSIGNPIDINASTANTVFWRDGGTLGFSALNGVALVNGSITDNKLATMSANTVKGRLSTSGIPSDLTGANVNTILPTFTQTLKGLVPAPTTVTGKVLSDNGTWIIPSTGTGSAGTENTNINTANGSGGWQTSNFVLNTNGISKTTTGDMTIDTATNADIVFSMNSSNKFAMNMDATQTYYGRLDALTCTNTAINASGGEKGLTTREYVSSSFRGSHTDSGFLNKNIGTVVYPNVSWSTTIIPITSIATNLANFRVTVTMGNSSSSGSFSINSNGTYVSYDMDGGSTLGVQTWEFITYTFNSSNYVGVRWLTTNTGDISIKLENCSYSVPTTTETYSAVTVIKQYARSEYLVARKIDIVPVSALTYQFGLAVSGQYFGTTVKWIPSSVATDLNFSDLTTNNKFRSTIIDTGVLTKFSYNIQVNGGGSTLPQATYIGVYVNGTQITTITLAQGSSTKGVYTTTGAPSWSVTAGNDLSFNISSTSTGVTLDGINIIAKVA